MGRVLQVQGVPTRSATRSRAGGNERRLSWEVGVAGGAVLASNLNAEASLRASPTVSHGIARTKNQASDDGGRCGGHGYSQGAGGLPRLHGHCEWGRIVVVHNDYPRKASL